MAFITNETKAGEPLHFGSTTIVPFANSIQVKVPFVQGGLIWNRPVAVAVQTAQGQEYVLPVQDVTRQILFALLGASVVSSFLIFFASRQYNRRKR